MNKILNKTLGTILVGTAIVLAASFLIALPFNFL
jgi:hypothetical protein